MSADSLCTHFFQLLEIATDGSFRISNRPLAKADPLRTAATVATLFRQRVRLQPKEMGNFTFGQQLGQPFALSVKHDFLRYVLSLERVNVYGTSTNPAPSIERGDQMHAVGSK